MQVVEEHIVEHLTEFIATPADGFEEAYNNVVAENKSNCKFLLIYIDKLLKLSLNETNEKRLKLIHIHIDHLPDEFNNALLEFLIVRFFYKAFDKDVNGNSEYFETKISELRRINSRNQTFPSYVSFQKPNKEAKKWLREKKENKARLDFFSKIQAQKADVSLMPNTLINVLHKEYDDVLSSFNTAPFCIGLDKLGGDSNYVILNTEKRRDEIDELKSYDQRPLLDNIENIILFNCENKQTYRDFNQKDLQEWNDNGACNFKNLILISTKDERSRYLHLRHRVERIKLRYQHTESENDNFSYIVIGSEIDQLIGRQSQRKNSIEFYGEVESPFWEDFRNLLSHYESLYELRSLKMMSIYSMCFNESFKSILLDLIFTQDNNAEILTSDTKVSIKELSADNVAELRESLSLVLDVIIKSEWRSTIMKSIHKKDMLLINEILLSNQRLLEGIARALNIERSRFISWKDIDIYNENIFVLDYRDLGPYPYNMKPNILESLSTNKHLRALFIASFFRNKFEWGNYNYRRDYISVINNPIRNNEFKSQILISKNLSLKPVREDNTLWDIETTYSNLRENNSIKVTFKDERSKVFYTSDLFLSTIPNSKHLKVERLDSLMEDYQDISLQPLDEIHKEFNLYEKFANVKKEEAELNIIRDKFQLANQIKPGAIWKVLLTARAKKSSTEKIYNEVKSVLEEKRSRLVSLHTFEQAWLDTESDILIPREKSTFFYLCEYLELPRSYYRIMLRLKNVEKQAAATSSRQMERFLTDLINDGCFEDECDVEGIITSKREKYIRKYDFEEVGLDTDNLSVELKALVELLKPKLRLRPVSKIEMNN